MVWLWLGFFHRLLWRRIYNLFTTNKNKRFLKTNSLEKYRKLGEHLWKIGRKWPTERSKMHTRWRGPTPSTSSKRLFAWEYTIQNFGKRSVLLWQVRGLRLKLFTSLGQKKNVLKWPFKNFLWILVREIPRNLVIWSPFTEQLT